MSGTRLCIPGINVSTPSQPLISVETASIRRPKTGSSSREWVVKQDSRSWSRRRQTLVLMHLIVPVIAACLFSCLPRRPADVDYVEKRNCCNAYWRHPVVINSQVNVTAAAVSDWLRSVTCTERGKSPALRRTGRVTGFGLISGLRPSGLRPRLHSIWRNVTGFPPGPVGISPLIWTARYFARILFLGIQLAGLFFVRPVPSNA